MANPSPMYLPVTIIPLLQMTPNGDAAHEKSAAQNTAQGAVNLVNALGENQGLSNFSSCAYLVRIRFISSAISASLGCAGFCASTLC